MFNRHIGVSLWRIIIILCVSYKCHASIDVSSHDLTILVDATQIVNLQVSENFNETVVVSLYAQHSDIIQIVPQEITIPQLDPSDNQTLREFVICILGVNPGKSVITSNATPSSNSTSNVHLRITVQHSEILTQISIVVGWMYFVAWSVSFYPQIYINYKRKSVVGLNFDFVGLNIVGFVLYSMFNVGLFFIPEIEQEYFVRYPGGLNPVQVNDIVFSLHAALATLLTIGQCILYERGGQTVSHVGKGLLGLCVTLVVISAGLAGGAVVHWLDFLYYCSYVKLGITLVKYVPQAYMNYKRKSTVGWSIGNIFLDLTGGLLSVLQMLLNAYNFDDWASIFGDPTKFGLGFFSVLFDVFFIVQHYILYRGAEKKVNSDDTI